MIETTAELATKEAIKEAASEGLSVEGANAVRQNAAVVALRPSEEDLTKAALDVPDIRADEIDLNDQAERAKLIDELDELKETINATADQIESAEDVVATDAGSGTTARGSTGAAPVDAAASVDGAQQNLDDAVQQLDELNRLLDDDDWTPKNTEIVEENLASVVVAVEEASSDLDDATAVSSVDVGQNRVEDASEVVRDLRDVLADDSASDTQKLEQVKVLEATLLNADEQLDVIGDDIAVPTSARRTVGAVSVTDALDDVVKIRMALEEDTPDDEAALTTLEKVEDALDDVDQNLEQANTIVTDEAAREAAAGLRLQGIEAVELIQQAGNPQTGRAVVRLHPFARLNHGFEMSKDMILFFVAMMAGVLGGSLMSLIRFTAPGEDEDWTRFRGLIGGGLALVVYFMIRGGLFEVGPTASNLNPYTIAGIAAIAGMYSTPITKRLAKIAGFSPETDQAAAR